jgi:hypothetical protein
MTNRFSSYYEWLPIIGRENSGKSRELNIKICANQYQIVYNLDYVKSSKNSHLSD